MAGPWYVNKDTGNDTTGDGSALTPWATIQKGINEAGAGETVHVQGDDLATSTFIYAEGVTFPDNVRQGIQLIGDNYPIIDAADTRSYCIQAQRSGAIRVSGFDLRRSTAEGCFFYDGDDGAVFDHNLLHDNASTGFVSRGSDDVVVHYNEVYDNGGTGVFITWRDSTVDAPVNPWIHHNLCYHNGVTRQDDGDGIGSDHSSEGGLYEYNLLWRNYDDGIDLGTASVGCVMRFNRSWLHGRNEDQSIELDVHGNPFYPGDGNGLKVSTKGGGGHLVYRNITFLNRYNGIDQDIDPAVPYNKFYNNTVYGNRNGGLSIDAGGRADAGNKAKVRNNALYLNGSIDYYASAPDPSHISIQQSDHNFIGDGNWSGALATVEGPSSLPGIGVTGNPLFVSAPVDSADDLDDAFTAGVDVNFTVPTDGTIEEKWTFINDQIEAAFGLQQTSACNNAGIAIVDGVYDITAGSSGLPDMGAIELVPETEQEIPPPETPTTNLNVSMGVAYNKGKVSLWLGKTFSLAVAGELVQDDTQDIATTETAIDLGALTTLGFAYFENLDRTNTVELRCSSGGARFAMLKAGEPAGPFRFGSDIMAPYAIATGGACKLRVIILEA